MNTCTNYEKLCGIFDGDVKSLVHFSSGPHLGSSGRCVHTPDNCSTGHRCCYAGCLPGGNHARYDPLRCRRSMIGWNGTHCCFGFLVQDSHETCVRADCSCSKPNLQHINRFNQGQALWAEIINVLARELPEGTMACLKNSLWTFWQRGAVELGSSKGGINFISSKNAYHGHHRRRHHLDHRVHGLCWILHDRDLHHILHVQMVPQGIRARNVRAYYTWNNFRHSWLPNKLTTRDQIRCDWACCVPPSKTNYSWIMDKYNFRTLLAKNKQNYYINIIKYYYT